MEAPFKIGQKVVVVKPISNLLKVGEIYTVGDCFQCPKCKEWHVGLLEFPSEGGIYTCGTNQCMETIKHFDINHYKGSNAYFFAPIDDQKERIRYVAVSETLREQAVEVAAIETN